MHHLLVGCLYAQSIKSIRSASTFLGLQCGGGKQGRPSGRPKKHTAGELVSTLTTTAPASFFTRPLPTITPTHIDMLCLICLGMLDRPIELECGNMVCLLCCTQWPTISNSVDCLCCYDHTHSPSRVTMAVLESQLVECGQGCNRSVRVDQYQQHISSKCGAFVLNVPPYPLHALLSEMSSTAARTVQQPLRRGSGTSPHKKN